MVSPMDAAWEVLKAMPPMMGREPMGPLAQAMQAQTMPQQTSPTTPPMDEEFMARIQADREKSQQRKKEREERKD